MPGDCPNLTEKQMAPRNEERRKEILSAVYSLVEEAPYDKISLSDIARKAGINKSLLQKYYPQKIDIFKEMLTGLLETSYSYMSQLPGGEGGLFQGVSNFNMLFFAGVARDFQMHQFILTTVKSSEILDIWIETICNWLRRHIVDQSFNMLELRCALCFAMGGTMHLFQHQEELGIDYRFFCEKHIRAILEFLGYSMGEIDDICYRTKEWIEATDVDQFLSYCRKEIDWIT